MKLTVERDALLGVIAKVRGASASKGTIPILGFVLLAAVGDALSATASNLDMQARAAAPCVVEAGGSICVPTGSFHDAVRSLPAGGEIALALSPRGDRLEVHCGNSRFELPTLPAADFPIFDVDVRAGQGVIAASTLARMIERTGFAISTEETRFYLCGLHICIVPSDELADAQFRAVATNGHQLAFADTAVPDGMGDMPPVILPSAYVRELARHLDATGDVELAVGAAGVRARVGGLELTGKVIDGSYPDYRRVLPKGEPERLTVSRLALLGAVKRAMIFASDKARSVVLKASRDGLRVEARSLELGACADDLDAVFAGEPAAWRFAGPYLVEMLELLGGNDAWLEFRTDKDPMVVNGPYEGCGLMLVMPQMGGAA